MTAPDRDGAAPGPPGLAKAAEVLARAHKVAVVSGAGISAESGVPTFREMGGLWEQHPVEEVATPEGFERNPRLVWEFYEARRKNMGGVQPNAGHYALAEMEEPDRIIHLPFEWPVSARRVSAHPPKVPPISKYLLRHPWHIPNLFARDVPAAHRVGPVRKAASAVAS